MLIRLLLHEVLLLASRLKVAACLGHRASLLGLLGVYTLGLVEALAVGDAHGDSLTLMDVLEVGRPLHMREALACRRTDRD